MALRDDDKVMAGLLRRTLASSPKPGVAPSVETPPGLAETTARLRRCSPPFTSIRSTQTNPSRYELALLCATVRCAASKLAAMARAEEDATSSALKASWAWIWNPYWLAPALAVLTLAIFFGVHHSSPTSTTAVANPPANAPLVAMSRPEQAPPQEPVRLRHHRRPAAARANSATLLRTKCRKHSLIPLNAIG